MAEPWNDDRRLILLPSQLSAVKRYVDNSVGVSFRSTLEVSVEDMSILDSFLRDKSTGQLGFAANRLNLDRIPKEDAPGDTKSRSQIARGLLWHLANAHKQEDTEAFYRRRYDAWISSLRDELDEKKALDAHDEHEENW